jgi:hypothetical protein
LQRRGREINSGDVRGAWERAQEREREESSAAPGVENPRVGFERDGMFAEIAFERTPVAVELEGQIVEARDAIIERPGAVVVNGRDAGVLCHAGFRRRSLAAAVPHAPFESKNFTRRVVVKPGGSRATNKGNPRGRSCT